jgi:hypothetical protein
MKPVGEAPSYALCFSQLAGEVLSALVEQPLPPMRPRQRADQRLVRPPLPGGRSTETGVAIDLACAAVLTLLIARQLGWYAVLMIALCEPHPSLRREIAA